MNQNTFNLNILTINAQYQKENDTEILKYNNVLNEFLDLTKIPEKFTPKIFKIKIEKAKDAGLNCIELIQNFALNCGDNFLKKCPRQTIDAMLEATNTDDGLYYDLKTLSNLNNNFFNILLLTNQNTALKILNTFLYYQKLGIFNKIIEIPEEGEGIKVCVYSFFTLGKNQKNQTTEIVLPLDKIEEVIIATEYDSFSIKAITETQNINNKIYKLLVNKFQTENKELFNIFTNIIKCGTYKLLSDYYILNLITNLNFNKSIYEPFNLNTINVIIENIAEYTTMKEYFSKVIIYVLKYQKFKLDTPIMLKLINNTFASTLFSNNLFPITDYQIINFDIALAMLDGIKNYSDSKDTLFNFIKIFSDMNIFKLNIKNQSIKNKLLIIKNIFTEYKEILYDLKDDFEIIEDFYRKFRQKIKNENKIIYKIKIEEKNNFVDQLSRLTISNTLTLNNFNSLVNRIEDDFLKTEVLEQFTYNNLFNSIPVRLNSNVLKLVLNIAINGIKNSNIYIVQNNCINILKNIAIDQVFDFNDVISIVDLFLLKNKEIGLYNIEKIFSNIINVNDFSSLIFKNAANQNITIKNILNDALQKKNKELIKIKLIEYDSLILLDFNDIKQKLKQYL